MRRNGARTCIFMIISKVSSGMVWNILSNVNPALFTMWLILPHFLYEESDLLLVQMNHDGYKIRTGL